MSNKDKALWTLVAAYAGAILQVPSLFLDEVLGLSFVFAVVAFIIVSIVSARKNRKAQA